MLLRYHDFEKLKSRIIYYLVNTTLSQIVIAKTLDVNVEVVRKINRESKSRDYKGGTRIKEFG